MEPSQCSKSSEDPNQLWAYAQLMRQVCPAPWVSILQPPPMATSVLCQNNLLPFMSFEQYMRYCCPNSNMNNFVPSNNDQKSMTIQIGLQCVNQNNSMNLNTVDVSVAKSTHVKDDSTRINNVVHNNFLEPRHCDDINCGLDVWDKNMDKNPNKEKLIQESLEHQKLSQITGLAMRGCELAENLVTNHRNRPCFKKIDSLCARLKQDLIRPDGVLPNINSQGLAWAIKDFIFVFTRIINAWIIIKGYVYNTSEGLSKVRSALSSEFNSSFNEWQNSTEAFVENIIKSFVNLDNLVQNQKVPFHRNDLSKNSGFDQFASTNNASLQKPSIIHIEQHDEMTNKAYFSTISRNSEETQRNSTTYGTYIKTGVYNPIQKCSQNISTNPPTASTIPLSIPLTNNEMATNNLLANKNVEQDSQYLKNYFNSYWQNKPTTFCNNGQGDCEVSPNNSNKLSSVGWEPFEFRILEENLTNFSSAFDPKKQKPIGADLTQKLEIILERLCNLSEGKYFFIAHFTRNYFPDFANKYPNFMDLRSIIYKAQVGGYSHVYEIIHDLKLIIHHAKIYLKTHQNDLLNISIRKYEMEIGNILADNMFDTLHFDHITGKPNEELFPVNK